MEATIPATPVVLAAAAIAAMDDEPLGPMPGVRHRVLWRGGASMAGVLTVDAGHRLGAHAHRRHHHHMWVIDGRADVLGTDLRAGSYVHIPSGVEHDIDARRTEGCTVFYLYEEPAT